MQAQRGLRQRQRARTKRTRDAISFDNQGQQHFSSDRLQLCIVGMCAHDCHDVLNSAHRARPMAASGIGKRQAAKSPEQHVCQAWRALTAQRANIVSTAPASRALAEVLKSCLHEVRQNNESGLKQPLR